MIYKVVLRFYMNFLKKRGLKIGEKNRWIYPFPKFSKPLDTIEIGEKNLFSGKVNFITHDGSSWVLRNLNEKYKKMSTVRKIKVGNNVFIGYNSTILSGVKIGNNVIIGAKSLVVKNCESNCVYAGIPAKKICTLKEYEEKFKKKYGGNIL